MKAKVKFKLEITIDIETGKDINDTNVLELQLKASNLGNCFLDTLRHMDTHKMLNEKINSDYKANITSINSLGEKQITI